jgi:hypothetical protein
VANLALPCGQIKKVIPEKRLEQQLQVMHLLDKLENDNMPDAEVSTNTLLFADTRCRVAQTRSFTLRNTGQVRRLGVGLCGWLMRQRR